MSDEVVKLTCTKVVKRDGGINNQRKQIWYHEKCGQAAAEYEIGGTLAKAKAVLCVTHKLQADREAFTSTNGFPMGKIDKKAKEKGYQQTRLPGTGVNDGARGH